MNKNKKTILKWACGILAACLVILAATAQRADAPISILPKTMNTAMGCYFWKKAAS